MSEKEEIQFISIKDLSLDKLLEIELKSVTNLLVDKRYKVLKPLIDSLVNKYGSRYRNAVSLILSQAALSVSKDSNFCKLSLNRNHYVAAKKEKRIKCGLDLVKNTLKMMKKDKLLEVYKGEYYEIEDFPFKTKGVSGGVTTVVEFHETLINHLHSCNLLRYVHCKPKPLHVIKSVDTKEIIHHDNSNQLASDWNTLLKNKVTILGKCYDVRYQKIEHTDGIDVFGGRWYCGAFQTIKSKYRNLISLEDKVTIECDYISAQPSLLCAISGLKIPEGHQVYEAYDGLIGDKKALRDLFKVGMLAIMYGESKNTAASNLFKNINSDKDLKVKFNIFSKKDIRKFSEDVVKRLIDHNNFMYHLLFNKNNWRLLQTVDSKICELVVGHFVDKGVPILNYHDSFRVDKGLHLELELVMQESWLNVVGNSYNCKIKV